MTFKCNKYIIGALCVLTALIVVGLIVWGAFPGGGFYWVGALYPHEDENNNESEEWKDVFRFKVLFKGNVLS